MAILNLMSFEGIRDSSKESMHQLKQLYEMS